MAKMDPAYDKTNGLEGFYSNDKDDSGGETLYGQARAKHPNLAIWAIVDNFKTKPGFPDNMKGNAQLLQLTKEFYKFEFWDKMKLDLVNNQMIAQELYDTAVNCGVSKAIEFLQVALNVANDGGRLYADIAQDGIVGAGTIEALNKHPKPANLYKILNTLQGAHYIKITIANPKNEKYLNGWFANRVFEGL